MAILNCKDCKNEVSSEARRCPHCGRPLKRIITIGRLIVATICILLVGRVIQSQNEIKAAAAADEARYQDLMSRVGRRPANGIEEIYNQVAQDAVQQYRIAKRQGDAMQICTQAGLVAAGFLQAKNEKDYVHWKDVEKTDCEIAYSN